MADNASASADAGGSEKFNPLTQLSEEQMAAFKELRSRVESKEGNELTTRQQKFVESDMAMCRYLRARDYNVNKSEKMLQNSLKWIEVFRPDTISIEDIAGEYEGGKIYLNGFDKQRRPIVYMRPARDKSKTREGKWRNMIYFLEKACAAMDATKGIESWTFIIDFNGTSVFQSDIRTDMGALRIMLDHYPERLGRALLLDPPWFFWTTWKIITPFINDVTRNKIIFTYKKTEYKELFDYVDADQLETCYGGKNEYVFTASEVHDRYLEVDRAAGRLDAAAKGQTDAVVDLDAKPDDDA